MKLTDFKWIRQSTEQEMSKNKCPKCGKEEICFSSPLTMYQCGSTDYDKTNFIQSKLCKNICKLNKKRGKKCND